VVEVERTIEAPDGHAFQHLKSLLDTLDGETLALAFLLAPTLRPTPVPRS